MFTHYFTLVLSQIFVHFVDKEINGVQMPTIQTKEEKERFSFFVDAELARKVHSISKENKLTISEITRKALHNFIEQCEKDRIENELAAGYQVNYNYYLKAEKDWNNADKE